MAEASNRDDFDDISVVIVQTDEQLEQYGVQAAQVNNPIFEETAVST